jgi:glycosyltransferase involved in cell wall biosynthesis
MIVGNDVVSDSRVRKEARSLADLGYRLTIVGLRSARSHPMEMLGDVLILRVPIARRVTKDRQDKRARIRAVRLPGLEYATPDSREAARLRLRLEAERLRVDTLRVDDRRSQGDLSGWASWKWEAERGLRRSALKGRVAGIRVRSAVTRRAEGRRQRAWSRWDEGWKDHSFGARWWRTHSFILDYELAFAPLLDALEPDAIHAHDFHMVAIAEGASARALAAGRRVPWVYDAHEFVAGLPLDPRPLAAWGDLEARYIRRANKVITVSEPIAHALQQRYGLLDRPTVVLNVPEGTPRADPRVSPEPGLRGTLGLDSTTPLILYSGGVTPVRGVHTAIEALQHLPGVHLAVICVPSTSVRFVGELRRRAEECGVEDRTHFVEPVGPDEVIDYMASADLGLIPMLSFPNHEMALPNKVFQYARAGLPVVSSDLQTLGSVVREYRLGATFEPEDPVSLAKAVSTVLADRPNFQARAWAFAEAPEFQWSRQVERLSKVYADLGMPPAQLPHQEEASGRLFAIDASQRLVIGPWNMAGQGGEWARSLRAADPDVSVAVMGVRRGGIPFPADIAPTSEQYASPAWQVPFSRAVLESATHVLQEAARPLFGWLVDNNAANEAAVLGERGIRVGMVLHGSEARDPAMHRELYEFSPFLDARSPLTTRLQGAVNRTRALLDDWSGEVFVTTPDLLDFVPGATLLPVTIDPRRWATSRQVLTRGRPLVVHVPSNPELKGTSEVDRVVSAPHDEGVVEYRRLEGVPHEQLPAVLAEADVVIDQITVGNVGVLACEAMAAGRLVIAHVHPIVRARVPGLPVVEADPATLEKVLRSTVAERDFGRAQAGLGPAYVQEHHDGRAAAAVLARFMG